MRSSITHSLLLFLFCMILCALKAEAQEARWIETNSWSGIGTQQTEIFPVQGNKWRIKYRFRGTGIFQVGIYDEHNQFVDIAADLREPMYGRKTRRDNGNFYLAITGIDAKWEVKIEQYVTVIQEWRLLKLAEQPKEPLVKVGTWIGSDGNLEQEVTIPADDWVVEYEGEGSGFAQILVLDDSGKVVVGVNMQKPMKARGWGHQAGQYVLKAVAADMDWKVNFLAQGKIRTLPQNSDKDEDVKDDLLPSSEEASLDE